MASDDNAVALRLAGAYAEQQRPAEALALLREVLARQTLTAQQRMYAAQALFRLGDHDDAVREAFRAVRADRDDPELQRVYMALVTQHEQTGKRFTAREVGPDTHVVLQAGRKGETVGYTLLAEGPADRQRQEFLARDASVIHLRGKKQGDTVVLRSGLPSARTYRVKEIKSAIVHLCQDILLHFGDRFPDNPAIQKFAIDKTPTVASFAPMLAQLHAQKHQVDAALEIYDEHLVPLGAVAEMIGRSPEVVYHGLVQRGRPYYTEGGHPDVLKGAIQAAASARPIVLTDSVLFTGQHLGRRGVALLDLLERLGRPVLVPQALAREFEELERELAPTRTTGRKSLGAGPAGFQFDEQSPADAEKEYQEVAAALAWMRRVATVGARPLRARDADAERLREVVGASGWDARELALAEEADLLTDDFGLRFHLEPSLLGRSFSTWALLQVTHERGLLPSRQFRMGIVTLIELHHEFVPVSAGLILDVLRDNAYEVNAQTRTVLDRLSAADVSLDSAVRVVGELLKELAVAQVGGVAFAPVALACLECLTAERRITPTVSRLQRELDGQLHLLPLQREAVQEVIDRFVAAKRRGGTLQ